MNIDKSNWEKVRFGDVVYEKKLTVDAKTCGLKRYIAGDHMNSEDLHLRRWGTIGEDYLGPAFHRKFEKGDILYGSRRTYLKKVAVADFDGVTANTTFVLTENTDLVVPGLVPFLMLSDRFTEHSIKNSKGSVNPYINFKDIAKFEFLLPPKAEQARLAELLWAADEMTEQQTKLLTVLTKAKDVYALENYESSKNVQASIAEIAELNPRIPKGLEAQLPVSFVTMADVSENGHITGKQERRLEDVRKGFTYFEEGDILFAKITPCMENGKGAIANNLTNSIGFGSTEFHVIRPKHPSDRHYCFYVSKMEKFRKEAEKNMIGSAGQKRVPASFFELHKIKLPNIDDREVFGQTMHKFDLKQTELRTSIEEAKALKQVLTNSVFHI